LLGGAFQEATELAWRAQEQDTEWNLPRWTHVHTLVEAFALGVVSADPWHHAYTLPPGFAEVVNHIAARLQAKHGRECVVQVSLIEVEEDFMAWGMEHPQFRQWNEPPDGALVRVVTRYTDTPGVRDFIDLHALVRNAVVWLRNERRREDAFDADRRASRPGAP
jgi:hypothetical protein